MANVWCFVALLNIICVTAANLSRDDIKSLIYTYQYKYCGRLFCDPNLSYQPSLCPQAVKISDWNDSVTIINTLKICDPCTECSCDDSCLYIGNCCSDKHIGDMYFITCEIIQLYKNGGTDESEYRIVTKCPFEAPNYDSDLAWKCEHGKIGYVQDGRPVTAPYPYNTSVTFRNKYCATCYGVTNYTHWNVFISCEDDFDSSNYTDINSLLRYAQETRLCEVSFELSRGRMPLSCYSSNRMISTCNVTGKWREYNESTKTACGAYFNPTKTWKYRNIFCQLCNGATEEGLACYSDCKMSSHKAVIVRPFAALLNFENSDAQIMKSEKSDYQIKRIGKQDAHQCRKEDVYDKQSKVCREVYCPLARKTRNFTCVPLVESKQYVLTLWQATSLYKEEIEVPFRIIPPSYSSDVVEKLKPVLKDLGFFVYRGTGEDYATIKSPSSLLIKESYLDLTLFLLSGFTLDVSRGNLKEKLTVNISWLGQHIGVDIVSGNRNVTNKLLMNHHFRLELAHSEMQNITRKHSITVPLSFNVSCYMVKFAGREVETINNSVIIHGYNILKNDEYFVITESGDYFICLDVLSREQEIVIKGLSNYTSNDSLTGPILTGICLSCSLLCLLITMLIYILIKELHTAPGLNLIFMTSSLFVAQAFYLFGAGTVTTPTICTVLGILIHYFWLVSFAWMNVCCFHMFRVFTNAFSSLEFVRNKKRLMLKYSAFAYGIATLIVGTTIVTTYVTSGYMSIAYGGTHMCFTSPGLVSIIAFGIPAGFAVLFNAVLLVITMVHLNRTSIANRHLHRSEASDISKFFKLSTITGVSWMFGFIGYFLQRVELLYVFTILTAGHGVFIFISFVASRRIRAMVKDKLCPVKRKGHRGKQIPDHSSESCQNSGSSATQQITIRL